MKSLIAICLLTFALAGCATPILGIDPIVSWDTVVTACDGTAFTGVTYNVYYSTAALPTVLAPAVVPCAAVTMIDNTKITKVNTAPITASPYNLYVPNGTYNVAVESVASDGTRGGFIQSSVVVLLKPGTPVNLKLN